MSDLTPAKQKFILHWGEMGARWGVNRTIAQIHAFLYLSPSPVTAEQIANTLSVARSNVSTSLKILQSWGLIKIVHVLGDRRGYFESQKDVWDLFKAVLEGRKQREVDPTLITLRECLEELEADGDPDEFTKKRLEDMLDFFETMTSGYEQIRSMSKPQLKKLAKLGSKLQKLLGG